MKMVKFLPQFFLFFYFFFLTSVNVSAQIKIKGVQVGGTGIAFRYPGAYQAGVALRGTVGLQLTNHWIVGIQPFYGRIWSGWEIITGKGTGLYTRLYALNGRFQPFGEFTYGRSKLNYTAADPVISQQIQDQTAGSKGEYILFGLGASFFLNKKRSIAIELSLPMIYMRNLVYRDTMDYQRFTPMIGAQYFFRKE